MKLSPIYLLLVSTIFSLPGNTAGEKKPVASPPNIIFILLDAARADHFSGDGYKKNTTPFIDAISRKGALFLKNFSPATETFNSMPLIFTSRYFSAPIFQKDTWRWGIKRVTPKTILQQYDFQQILLPGLLSLRGYRTAIFHNHWWFVKKTDFIKAHDESHIFSTARAHPVDGRIIDSVISWLKSNERKPFYIYCHIMSPHQPYPSKKEDKECLSTGDESELQRVRNKFYTKNNETTRGWNSEDLEYLRVLYDSNLKHTDSQIGRLYEQLKELGLAGNTLFIITSDHGENLGQHGSLNHGGPPWDSCIHVPLIMVYPPGIPSGVRIAELTESIDIMPTIVDLCKLKLPPGKSMDGVSLTNLFKSPNQGKKVVYTKDSIRTPEYKYMLAGNLLFDLKKDAGETNNISQSNKSLTNKLRIQYNEFMAPYKQRYQKSVLKSAPDFSFFYPLRIFSFSPPGIIQAFAAAKQPGTILKEISISKPWSVNREMHNGGLFCLPEIGSPSPITFSTRLPNGEYEISMLIKPLKSASLSQLKTSFRARFDPQKTFRDPVKINHTNYYFDWGRTTINNEKFTMEIEYHSKTKIPYFIGHVRFDPVQAKRKEAPKALDDKEFQRRKQNLKSLGYL